jgi:hypothetical protein
MLESPDSRLAAYIYLLADSDPHARIQRDILADRGALADSQTSGVPDLRAPIDCRSALNSCAGSPVRRKPNHV